MYLTEAEWHVIIDFGLSSKSAVNDNVMNDYCSVTKTSSLLNKKNSKFIKKRWRKPKTITFLLTQHDLRKPFLFSDWCRWWLWTGWCSTIRVWRRVGTRNVQDVLCFEFLNFNFFNLLKEIFSNFSTNCWFILVKNYEK